MQQAVIRRLMRLRENRVAYDASAGATFRELFDHPAYRELGDAAQIDLGLQWARELHHAESERSLWERYFAPADLPGILRNAAVLDIGCYIGGKTVSWLEHYRAASIHGIDIDPRFIRIAEHFARERRANARFSVAFAEKLPFQAGQFDAIVSENTFEHVRDLRQVMAECARVLRPGGHLIVIFPSFWGPWSHHLDLVTRTPCIHWLFGYPALLRAYFALLDERGEEASWYRRREEWPLPFERGYSINGTSDASFRRLIRGHWAIVCDGFREQRSGNRVKRVLQRLGVGRELMPIAYVLRRR